jgi:large subunit ribosomal protein L16
VPKWLETKCIKREEPPLHTLRADIDYHNAEALTKVGLIGIKVWICRGEKYGKQDLTPNFAKAKKQKTTAKKNKSQKVNINIYIIYGTMLQPRKTKYRKQQKGRMKGNTTRGAEIAFGSFAIKSLESAWITGRQLEAARQAVTRYMKREGNIWIRVFPDKPVTKKPAEVRMGKGKGEPELFVARVKPGRILFEADGVPENIAREAMRLAAQKLPVKTKFIIRRDYVENL